MARPCGERGRFSVGEYQPRSPCCREEYPDDAERLCKSCADYRSYRQYVLEKEPPYHAPEGFAHMPYWQAKGLPEPDREKKSKRKEETDAGQSRTWEDMP